MKKIGDLMKEIGFNPNASDSVKEAFIKHLIKQSTGSHVQTPSERKTIFENPDKFISLNKNSSFTLPTQMSFDFENLSENKINKKVV
ncbi:MAG: hypothetical protein WA160_07760 [Pseudobdellovibrio sp.]